MKRRFAPALAAVMVLTLAASTAFACKTDYCNGSAAPTSLGQVGGAQNYQQPPAPPTPTGCVPAPTGNFGQDWSSAEQAVANMPLSTLYNFMMSLPPGAAQYLFYRGTYNYSAQDQFQNYVRDNMFGGDQNAMNTWINNEEYNDPGVAGGGYSIQTGQLSYNPGSGTVTNQVPGWICP